VSIEIHPDGIVTRITKHLDDLKQRIGAAADAAGRSVNEITILAASKGQSVDAIHEAADSGFTAMGENYAQEALDKIAQLGHQLEWHFIGKLQSNKTRAIAENFDWVHTVTSEKLARRLSEQRPEGSRPLSVCVQVCTDPELSHTGCKPDAVEQLCATINQLPRLQIRGLMTLPLVFDDPELQRLPFRQLRELYEKLVNQGLELDTLSMGMSSDLEAAIMEGSTMLRIGTAIFGPRLKHPKPD